MSEEERILTQHPKGLKGVNILLRRYEVIRDYLISKIKARGEITYQELSDLAEIELAESFDGKVAWYVVSVKLDLEARNVIERIPKTSPHKVRMVD